VTKSFRRGFALGCAALLLAGCGTFALPRVYVLGDLSPAASGVTDEAGLAHLELKTVTVPDYLDTTRILRRGASHEVIASQAGQWGERVSIGVTRALAADLARRLPSVVIESREAYEPPRRLLVDVERFEIGEDGACTLTARWRVSVSGEKVPSPSHRGTFIETATSNTDEAAAWAMTSAIDQLAGQIATTIQASP
jgi:uncharacterized lipoprotein YmbA